MRGSLGVLALPDALLLFVIVIVTGVEAVVVGVLFAVIYNLFARRFRILEIEAE